MAYSEKQWWCHQGILENEKQTVSGWKWCPASKDCHCRTQIQDGTMKEVMYNIHCQNVIVCWVNIKGFKKSSVSVFFKGVLLRRMNIQVKKVASTFNMSILPVIIPVWVVYYHSSDDTCYTHVTLNGVICDLYGSVGSTQKLTPVTCFFYSSVMLRTLCAEISVH